MGIENGIASLEERLVVTLEENINILINEPEIKYYSNNDIMPYADIFIIAYT